MNQFYNDLKRFIKTHWETILLVLIILTIVFTAKYSDIKAGILDGWNGK
ncbi:MAG: hypothetical protein ACK4YH_06880 [Bacteroidota bacterium]|jgi:hypothetical protein